ncbi:MAG TPA: CpsB/CapC family capsule biosynthesis tyrosine phosphatase, partial [Chloroflexota bacterium]
GSQSVEESCDMARALLEVGVTTVCCTPHTTEWAQAGDQASIGRHVEALRAVLVERDIRLELQPGAEAHITPTLAGELKAGRWPTLNGTPYMLLEFPYDYLPPFYEQVIFELQASGFRPLIAHPERIGPIVDDPNLLYRLVTRGCLGQLTAMSLAGGFGPRVRDVSQIMVENRLVHVVATDAHDAKPGSRLFAIPEARAAAARLAGEAAAVELFDMNPVRIAAGEPVHAPEPLQYRKRFSILRAFR